MQEVAGSTPVSPTIFPSSGKWWPNEEESPLSLAKAFDKEKIFGMQYRRLGSTGIVVSELCMGTMTFGSQNTEKEAFAILDRAFDAGIDFFDTAEIYPVPPKPEWVHTCEEIVGRWLKTKPRDAIYMATKVVGPGHGWFKPPVRHGKTTLDRHSIRTAIEGSLRRLQTDYIDLYQTHWPDADFGYEETMETLTELQQQGLIRVAGSSNENAQKTTASTQASVRKMDRHSRCLYIISQ
tara:strand:- start:1775 stop:2485 length:711 start_codon:yes stop_codon:yes gene_type:complete